MSHYFVPAIMIASFLFAPLGASAQSSEGEDKFLLEIGSLSTDADTVIRVDGSAGNLGTSIDFESDLGFETGKQINRINARYRFTDKHSMKYAFFQLNRGSNKVIDRSLVIGDTTYDVNANLTARFDYSLQSVSYGYALHSSEDAKLDLLGGLYYVQTELSVSEPSLGRSEAVNGAGPLPLIGLNYERNLSGAWNLGASATLFKLDVGDYDGTVLDGRVRVDYQFTDRFGLGLAYNWQRLNVGVEDTNASGDFDLTTTGAEISAVLRF